MTSTSAHRRKPPTAAKSAPAVVRVAAYTRRSVEKSEQEFGSIEAQREAIEGYVTSRRGAGWTLLPQHYDDRGISGATLERPAFQQLLRDVDSGLVDVIAVYKFDRLSRNFVDFVQLIGRLERQAIAVVSTTEAIDTSTDIGRLLLNVLASFAEFTRKQIAERIADKMRASRRKGLWQGGRQLLGYDVVNKTLAVNHAEAQDVVAIFQTFARTTSIVATLRELEARGIRLKSFTTQRSKRTGGAAFRDHSLRTLLSNPVYVGQMHAGDEVVDGAQRAIVPRELFDEVQALLAGGRKERRAPVCRSWSGLLTGVLHCAACGAGMVPSHCNKKGRRYGYYVCQSIKARGAQACPGSRVAQGAVEAAVVERIMAIGRDPALVAEAVAAARAEVESQATALAEDAQRAGTEAHRLAAQRDDLVARGADVPELRQRLEVLREAHEAATARASAAKDELAALNARVLDEDSLRRAIESVAPCWEALFPAERARLIRLLVERVNVDARTGDITVNFLPTGVAELAGGNTEPQPRRSES